MKKYIYLLLVFLLFCIGNIRYVSASHLMGAEITWTCIGQDSFMIKLVLYRDCNGITLGSSPINFKCATSGASITSLNIAIGIPVDITPICKSSCTRCQSLSCSFPYGIHKYSMQGLVILNSAGTCCNIDISWSQNARSAAITTITGAGSSDLYVEAKLNRCQNPCDNSPSFNNDPIAILCVGQDFNFDNGAQDIDVNNTGSQTDSLTYEWGHPLAGPGSNIVYIGQYAYNKPVYFWGFPNDALPFPRGIHLDPQTGSLQFRPMKAEATVMVVQVNEFRNGAKIAEIRRDMMVIVITCTSNNPPIVTTPNNIRYKNICGGDSSSFTFSTSDPNTNDTVTISSSNIPQGSVWTQTNGQSRYPTATLSWKTTNADANSSPYTFYVTVKDNACPLSATFSNAYQFNVKFRINGNIAISDSGGGLYHFALDTTYNEKLIYVLNIAGKKDTLDSTNNYQFDIPGIYPYIFTVSYPNACNTISDTGVITTDTFLYARLPADTAICSGTSIVIEPRVFLNKGPVKYSWSTGDTNKILHAGPITNNQTITLTVKDSTGHTSKRSIKITMLKSPAMIPADTAICFGSTFSIEPLTSFAKGSVTYIWSTGDTNRILHTGRIYSSTSITLIVKDSTGCTANNSMLINTLLKSPAMIPADTTICFGSTFSIEPLTSFAKGQITYTWSTGDTNRILHTGRIFNITSIALTIIDSTGCTVNNSILINTKKNFSMLPDNMGICEGNSINIEPDIYFTKGHVSYNWNTGDTNKILQTGRIYNNTSFSVIVIDSAGCTIQDTTYISMLSNPEISMIDKIELCKNTSGIVIPTYQIFGSNNSISSFKWQKSGNQSVISNQSDLIVSDAGVYLFTVMDKFGCWKTDSIRVILYPAIDTSLEVNGSKLTANPGLKRYDWYRNASFIGSMNINVFIVPYIGWFFAILTDSYDCIDTTRMVFIKPTGINSQMMRGLIKIYPNPTSGKLILEANEPIYGDINLIVMNMYGREIINKTLKAKDLLIAKEIDISDQQAGSYTVIIRYHNTNFHQLIIKE